MLSRYTIVRGRRAADFPRELRDGTRVDTRKHTRHCLRPPKQLVASYLENPNAGAWESFRAGYRREVEKRFGSDRESFDKLAKLAMSDDVFLGCNCPTKKNPDPERCHVALALEFMAEKYPGLEVRRQVV